jgi:nitrate/TMAO reductase-like tetraheme cytochrome c subunit
VIGALSSGALPALRSAAALQQVHDPATDSVVVESPLPGGVAQVVRFLLNTVPPWLQMAGVVLGVIVAAVLLRMLFVRRRAIRDWTVSRSREAKIALGVAALLLVVAAAGMGAATWNYTQHSNDFCTGCHVMNPAFQRFAEGTGGHADLSCHDCHQQPLSASARQLYLWVAERPEEIGEHAKVPNEVCERCHVTGDTATWQRIAATAGHRVHLESDSSDLRDLQCVTCHGVEVHRFRPVAQTCGQSGCHAPEETQIVLGAMAEQTVRHCTSCHEFTADVPLLATRDDARTTFVPRMSSCLGCHEMQRIMADFDERRDPHEGACGMCHNPHEQETPAAAAATCASAGCHSNWENEPFHVGPAHRRVASQCLTCHMPHSAKVDASNCEGCHRAVRQRSRRQPPLPFDTAAALRRVSSAGGAQPQRVQKTEPPWPRAILSLLAGRSTPVLSFSNVGPETDTFSHARHERIACLVCHQTGEGHGLLTFERPRGCMICHHQAPATSRCATCHRPGEYAVQEVTVTVQVPGHEPRSRPVDFQHSPHASRTCVECHTTPVTLAPTPAKAQCRDCHGDHHTVGPTCATCHAPADPGPAHPTLEIAHQRCDACHASATIERLTPTRTFCGACHEQKLQGHYDQKQCTTCHFLAEPGEHRSRLVTRPAG